MAPKPIVFIAAATRSGSTHIKNCFALSGWRPVSMHVAFDGHNNEEHMIDPRLATVLFPQGDFVIQQHVRAIGRNAPILAEFDIRPIVTYRNLSDSVVSLVDSTEKDFALGRGKGYTHVPIHLPDWTRMSLNDKLWWTIYNMVPWWCSFLLSWKESGLDCLFVDCDTFFADQVMGLRKMFDHVGVRPPDTLSQISSLRRGKLNVGVSGRGERLSGGMHKVIRHQASLYGLEEELCDRSA